MQSIACTYPILSATCSKLRWLTVLIILFGTAVMAFGQEPLKPPDRSSPRAALKTFLDGGDNLGTFLKEEYLDSPSRAGFHRAIALGDVVVHGLNLSETPSAARWRTGRSAAVSLYATLNRIPLPSWEAIPNGTEDTPDGTGMVRWVIPNTEIVLEKAPGRLGEDEFLFSPKTVERASEFYGKVENLPL